ncbi:MAG: hypothetical protein QNJ94_09125 [Alphaproteobacteria bacterium]|nr:hypothetical protein [Alphaproteobacteria bacterium]
MTSSEHDTQGGLSERRFLVLALLNLVLLSGLSIAVQGHHLINEGSNQISQLPIVLRTLDPGYLAHDWYVNQMGGFSARKVFALLVAGFAQITGLAAAYLILNWASVAAVGIVTFFVTRHVFGGDRIACLMAGLLVVVLSPFTLGNVQSVVNIYNGLVPESLAKPLILAAVACALCGRPVLCGMFAALAALFQPLVGTVAGVLSLVTLLLMEFARPSERIGPRDGTRRGRLLRIAAGAGLLAMVAFFWAVTHQSDVSDELFVQIVAYVRNPHHFLPSTFGTANYLKAAIFLLGSILVLHLWRRSRAPDPAGQRRGLCLFMVVYAVLLLGLCVAGYVFVELRPVKEIAALQAFRHLFVWLWFTIIVLSLVTAELLPRFSGIVRARNRRPLLTRSKGVSPFPPAAAGVYARRWIDRDGRAEKLVILVAGALLLLLLGGLVLGARRWSLSVPYDEFALAGVVGVVVLMFAARSRRVSRAGLWVIPAFLVAGVMTVHGLIPLAPLQRLLNETVRVNVTLEQVAADPRNSPEFRSLVELSAFAKDRLPADAIVLTPPDFGSFRVFAERAIVVDFKSWVFHDPVAWFERLTDVYGPLGHSLGFRLRDDLNRAYADITDRRLSKVAERYGARFAVLDRSTDSEFPVLFETDRHKLVRLDRL